MKFPKSTEFNKRIPKQKFYDNLNVTPAIKQFFTEQIKSIIWKNKIAPSTLNIAEGTSVKEIEVFDYINKVDYNALSGGRFEEYFRNMPEDILPDFLKGMMKNKEFVCDEYIKRVITPFITKEDLDNMYEMFNVEKSWNIYSKSKEIVFRTVGLKSSKIFPLESVTLSNRLRL